MSPHRRVSGQPPLASAVRLLVIALVVCMNVALGAGGARAQPGTVDYIGFSDKNLGDNDVYHYHDVTFLDNDASGHLMSIVDVPGTGQKAIEWPGAPNDPCLGEFYCPAMHIAFDEPQSTLTLSVVPPPQGFVTVLSSVTPLGQGVYQALDFSACGGGALPPLVGLTLTAPGYIITEAKVYFTTCSAPHTETGPISPIIVTGLTYTLPLHPVPPNTTLPTVTITAPQPHQVIAPLFSGDYVTDLEVTGTLGPHTAIYQLTAYVNFHAPVEMVYGSFSTSQQYSGSLQLNQSNGLQVGSNAVTVIAEDFEHHHAYASVQFTLQPPPLNTGDYVKLAAYTVTQTIDGGPQRLTNDLPAISNNPKNGYVVDAPSDALMQGKETLVRVFAVLTHAANTTTGALRSVPALATVRPAGCDNDSCALATSMLPVTIMQPRPKTGLPTRKFNPGGITVSPYSPPSPVPPYPDSLDRDELDLNSTWDFVLQPGWTMQDLTVEVTIDDGQYASRWGQPPQAAVPEQCIIAGDRQCYNAHRLELHLFFWPTATIVVAPVIVTVDGDYECNRGPKQGQTFTVNHLTPTQNQIDETFRMLNILYPLNAVEGPTVNMEIDARGTGPLPPVGHITIGLVSPSEFLLTLVDDAFDSSQEDFVLGLVPRDLQCPYSFGFNEPSPSGGVVTGRANAGDLHERRRPGARAARRLHARCRGAWNQRSGASVCQ